MYYLQSRYYDANVGRFINADEAAVSCISEDNFHNSYSYCKNNPVNSNDYSGFITLDFITAIFGGGTLATAGAGSGALATSGVGVGASGTVVGGVAMSTIGLAILAVLGIVVVAAMTIAVAKSIPKKSSFEKTRYLADVKVKQQVGNHYYAAYISEYEGLIRIGKRMNFVEALAALGITGATNSVTKTYKFTTDRDCDALIMTKPFSKTWGIYSHSQEAAKALAFVLGFKQKPEVHGTGKYGHYHGGYYKDGKYVHVFHIWFGGIISY